MKLSLQDIKLNTIFCLNRYVNLYPYVITLEMEGLKNNTSYKLRLCYFFLRKRKTEITFGKSFCLKVATPCLKVATSCLKVATSCLKLLKVA